MGARANTCNTTLIDETQTKKGKTVFAYQVEVVVG